MAEAYDPLDPPTFDATNANHDAQDADDDEYDPDASAMEEDPATAETSQPSRVASTAPRPLTQAGFIVDTSEEEDAADDTLSQMNGISGVQPTATDLSVAEAKDVSLGSAPTQDTTSAASQLISPVGSAAASLNAPVLAVVSPTPVPLASTTPNPAVSGQPAPAQNGTAAVAQPQRMAHDKVGQLEDRISDEPRADPSAWMSLVQYYREKDQLDNVRKTYDRFVEVYPTTAAVWLAYLNFEQEQDDHARIDALLGRALMKVLNVDIWLFYLNVLRRRHPLINDTEGKNRAVLTQAFDLVLDKVGIDPDAGQLWRDYIDFLKSGPGNISAASNHWQDQQKADLLRKAYHRAVTLPNDELGKLWKEYDTFENGLNRAVGRKFIQERSPHYMTARSAKSQLDDRLRGLDRKSIPQLPPLPGFAGDEDFAQQLTKWKAWIDWEKSDELVLKQDDDAEGYRKRVNYAYRQATMSLRFFPDIWFEAAAWCFDQDTEAWRKEGEAYLDAGISANPESALLALRMADVVELSFRGKGDSDEVVIGNGNKLDAVFEKLHKTLYALKKKYEEREQKALVDLTAYYDSLPPEEDAVAPEADDDEDEEERQARPKTREQQRVQNSQLIKATTVALQDTLKRTISYVWVAKLRAFHRVQGQGKPGQPKKGMRGVLNEARPRGSLTSDVYVASALLEYHCYEKAVAEKIFDRGAKLFPLDEVFILEFMKHYIVKGDITNAKTVFETSITRIEKAESLTPEQRREKCRPLLLYMYSYESDYGDLAAIHKLEKRLADMFPEEPDILRFGRRFQLPSFDGSRLLLAISPSQTRPKELMAMAPTETLQPIVSIENGRLSPQPGQILLGPHGPYVASPKRPLDDSDDGTPSRKFLRGESPLKGAAGRRIATASGAASAVTGGSSLARAYAAPQPLPPALTFILSILPTASSYQATRFDPHRMVDFLRSVDLTRPRM
ncbi:hypothetical protein AMS68_005704 [Peltaster fructicola]|uniref:mRNA 3'-end-processing protein RNA14 n=1 Tax=Peltaster fructicola TaxID=286661 RepID=A0A6H0XZK4_9PEZI|nr:hypothetical protein AMS68_005704 [Peltaster fructicola]